MKFALQNDLASLEASASDFLLLAGSEKWKRRAAQLAEQSTSSPLLRKIVDDYHWLELSLSKQLVIIECAGRLENGTLSLHDLAALHFAQMIVEVHKRLSARAKTVLEGRIRDSMKAENGFSGLYLEFEMARRLMDAGFEIEFIDLENIARYDLWFCDRRLEGEVECKSLSADAGRKIHRKDFYRFVNGISPDLIPRIKSGANEIILITLDDRLPADHGSQSQLRYVMQRLLKDPNLTQLEESFFRVEREAFSKRLPTMPTSVKQLYEDCRSVYGDNCHVSGVLTENACCLILMRSKREDDHSKPILDALKKAATQFSRTRPAFIAVQFDDIEPTDLLSVHLRRRTGLLSYHFFHQYAADHVLATYFAPYRGLTATPGNLAVPAIGIPNPKTRFTVNPLDFPPFLMSIPDADFAALLRQPPPSEDLTYIPVELKGDLT
jgi:hypothetical protein